MMEFSFWKIFIFASVSTVVMWFIFAENVKPFLLVKDVNNARFLAEQQRCDEALALMKKIPQETHVAEYIRSEFLNTIRDCFSELQDEQAEQARLALAMLQKNVESRPTFTRYWLSIANYDAVLLKSADVSEREKLLQEGLAATQQAEELSPGRKEEYWRTRFDLYLWGGKSEKAGDLLGRNCEEGEWNNGRCWWLLGLAHIGMGNFNEADQYLQKALTLSDEYYLSLEPRMNAVISQYIFLLESNPSEDKKAEIYTRLRDLYLVAAEYWPNKPGYFASLAFTYQALGDYGKARSAALHVRELDPNLSDQVEMFLQSLPN